MQVRVCKIGGTFQIHSQATNTELQVVLPLKSNTITWFKLSTAATSACVRLAEQLWNIQTICNFRVIYFYRYCSYCLFAFPISSRVASHHISYDLQYPMGVISKGVSLYFLAIIFTPFFSTIKRMWLVGLLTLSAMLLAKLFFHEFVISVWCFFAAVISFVVLYMIPILNQHIKTYRNA